MNVCESCNTEFEKGFRYTSLPLDSEMLVAAGAIVVINIRPQIQVNLKRLIISDEYLASMFAIRCFRVGNRVLFPVNVGDTNGSLFTRKEVHLAPVFNQVVHPGMDIYLEVVNLTCHPKRFMAELLAKETHQ